MKRYPAWQAIFRSFYSTDFYKDAAINWKGLGFLYLCLLAGFNSLVWAIMVQIMIANVCDKHLFPIADQFPTITVKDDKFSMDKPSPYKIEDPTYGTIFTFDTSGKTTTLDHPGMLITDSDVSIAQPQQSTTGSDVSTIETKSLLKASAAKGAFNKTDARGYVQFFRTYVSSFLFAFAWMGGTIFVLIQAIVYGLFGLIFNSILKTGLTYTQLTRLAAIAITPPLIVDTVVKIFLLSALFTPLGWLASFAVSMGYLFLGVRACKTLPLADESTSQSVPA